MIQKAIKFQLAIVYMSSSLNLRLINTYIVALLYFKNVFKPILGAARGSFNSTELILVVVDAAVSVKVRVFKVSSDYLFNIGLLGLVYNTTRVVMTRRIGHGQLHSMTSTGHGLSDQWEIFYDQYKKNMTSLLTCHDQVLRMF